MEAIRTRINLFSSKFKSKQWSNGRQSSYELDSVPTVHELTNTNVCKFSTTCTCIQDVFPHISLSLSDEQWDQYVSLSTLRIYKLFVAHRHDAWRHWNCISFQRKLWVSRNTRIKVWYFSLRTKRGTLRWPPYQRWYPNFDVVVRLAWCKDHWELRRWQRSYWQYRVPDRSKVMRQTNKDTLVLQVGRWARYRQLHPVKKNK
jgi:hypothetical protein